MPAPSDPTEVFARRGRGQGGTRRTERASDAGDGLFDGVDGSFDGVDGSFDPGVDGFDGFDWDGDEHARVDVYRGEWG